MSIKDNVKKAQSLDGLSHPVHCRTVIKKVKIPLLPKMAPEGLPKASSVGFLNGEWVEWKPRLQNSDSSSAKEVNQGPVILYAHGGVFVLGSRKSHRGITWRLSKYCKGKVLGILLILKKLIIN